MEGLMVASHLQPSLPFPIPTEEAVQACTWTSLDTCSYVFVLPDCP